MLEELKQLNPELNMKELTDDDFSVYGKVIEGIKVTELEKFVYGIEATEDEYYVPDSEDLQGMQESEQIRDYVFGQVPCQIGYYYGFCTKLNAVEYHKCSEVLFLLEDAVLILGNLWDIKDDKLDTAKMKVFFVPKGTCVELYATTLHYAPCMVHKSKGIRQIVCQSLGTNTPLGKEVKNRDGENKFLLEKNKWVLIHPEAKENMSENAYIGIDGKNIELVPLEV